VTAQRRRGGPASSGSRIAAFRPLAVCALAIVAVACDAPPPPGPVPSAPVAGVPFASGPAAPPAPESGPPATPQAADTAPAAQIPAASAPPAPPSDDADPPPAPPDGSPTPVTLAFLSSFEYVVPGAEFDDDGNLLPAAPVADPVPRRVRGLSGRRVVISGYLIPFDVSDGSCASFALAAFGPECCFGCALKQHDWVQVRMAEGRRAKLANDGKQVRVVGILQVHGPDDPMSPLYTLVGESVEPDL
jgi:hypothetical protein